MNKSNFTIGCLSLSAVVLFLAMLILAELQTPRIARASDMLSTAGTFTMLTGQLSPSNDLVYLIDTKTQKLAVYRVDETSRQVELIQVLPLDAPGQDQDAPKSKLKP